MTVLFESRIRDILELLPLAVQMIMSSRNVLATTSFDMPLMTTNGNDRGEWIVAVHEHVPSESHPAAGRTGG
jgi:hypothetical protein